MNRKLILYSFISGILLSIPWLGFGLGWVSFFALIPFFFLEEEIYNKRKAYKNAFIYSYIMFFVWNAITTWWIWNATKGGGVFAVMCNSMFFTITYMLIFFVRKQFGRTVGRWSFIFIWIGFEFFYINSEIAWTWLTLGHAFAENIRLIQWYEYLGTLGGSAWILVSNILIYEIYKTAKKREKVIFSVILSIVIILPITYSLIRFYTYKESTKTTKVLVLQPNIDPFNEKFGSVSPMQQLEIMLNLADSKIDSNVSLIVAPETSLVEDISENDFQNNYYINRIKTFSKDHHGIPFLMGASTMKFYSEKDELPSSVRKRHGFTYDRYNTALFIDTNSCKAYHKSKLVVGVEKIPYQHLLTFMSAVSIELGGSFGTLGTQTERTVFRHSELKLAPIICYESIFGEYVTQYVRNGANLLCVITNDGWWKDTPGYRQHLSYSSLRAIETRRSVVRSANTGISCTINPKGEIFNKTQWWTKDVFTAEVSLNSEPTFYVIWGYFIGRVCLFIGILFIIVSLVKRRLNKASTKH